MFQEVDWPEVMEQALKSAKMTVKLDLIVIRSNTAQVKYGVYWWMRGHQQVQKHIKIISFAKDPS